MLNMEIIMNYYFTAILFMLIILLALFGGPNYG